ELILDEPRGVIYAADFTAGQVDVISTATNRLVSSMNMGRSPSGLALSPDGQYLVVTNYLNLGTTTISSITVINLNDLSRQNYAISYPPLAVAFGADGAALITTTVDIQRFRPNGGTFEVVCPLSLLSSCIPSSGLPLPVPEPKFPREITKASMSASGDGNYIFGLTDTFLFVYQVPSPSAVLNVRLTASLFHPLAPPLITAAFDGSYFMAGQYVLDRRLRVMAENPDTDRTQVNLGGGVIDFGLRRLYASYAESVSVTTAGGPPVLTCTVTTPPVCTLVPGTTTTTTLDPPRLLLQDADNMTIRDRILLPERITGRVVLAGGGRFLYAGSESGVLYLPLAELAAQPQVRPAAEQVFFQFDFCQRNPLRQFLRIEGNADFQITTLAKGVTFNPSSGKAPATVEIVVDFAAYAKVQGTTHAQIVITSQTGVNQLLPIALEINVKDADQRGRLVPLPGQLVDILADSRRDQFYVLEQTKNELHVFQNSDLRLLGTFRTGNQPTWMSLSSDRRYLLVANSAGENLTVINLDTMQNEGYFFLPYGDNPISVATDNNTILVAARRPEGRARLDSLEITRRYAAALGTLGVYTNDLSANTAMVPMANMGGIFIAEDDGNVKLWDAGLQLVTLSRKPFGSLKGAIAAGPTSVVVENNVMNLALVPQSQFTDAPGLPAGFAFVGEAAVRTASPGGVVTDTGTVQRFDVRTPGLRRSPVRMVEAPLTTIKFPFIRTLTGLRNGNLISTSTTGLIELPGAFDAGIAIPRVTAITSAADFSDAVAPGGLISIFGQNLAPETAGATALPLPTSLASICVTVNGLRMPLLYASPTQINGQLPFDTQGQATTVLHTPGGLSDIYYANVKTVAPAVFQISAGGQTEKFPAVIRAKNSQLATLSNPLHPNDTFLIFATGLGEVGPAVGDGFPGPVSPLSSSRVRPAITVGGKAAPVDYAGLAPGFVGVYQLNVRVPGDAPEGMQIPLTINMGTASTTINVRVVD
ncbi:MAG: hypothetical protein HY238_14060, partial [Acidobacteria bacterium]|nr:hypothetical protein [Acidobacteriota bacterium]